MNRRKLLRYFKDHPEILNQSRIINTPHLDESDIPEKPDWLQGAPRKQQAKHRTLYAVMGAVVGALAMFVFMLSPVGNAVSEFVYNIESYWNGDKASFNFSYKGNVGDDPDLSLEQPISSEFTSIEEVEEVFPDLKFVRNDNAEVKLITISGDVFSTAIISQYNIGDSFAIISQTIFNSETAVGGRIDLTENAVPVEIAFHHGEIPINGAYEDGYGYIMTHINNCEFVFICDNLPLDTFTKFVEESYIK